MVAAEIYAGLQGFNAMLNGAKALKDMNDAAVRNAAVIELQSQILSAQAQQSALIQQVGELEEKVRKFETWDTEKKRYELKNIGWGVFAYMLKPEARGTEPAHWVCTNCYGNGKVSVVLYTRVPGVGNRNRCPSCHNELSPPAEAYEPGTQNPRWFD